MDILALDFDGVLCDSAVETAVSAYRAGRTFWSNWTDEEPPPWAVEGFVRVRPYLETGYQAVLMMRMVMDGRPESDFREGLEERCEALMASEGIDRESLVRAFGGARDRWIREDEADWLSRHRFYAGVLDRLREALRTHEVLILTTKQERFVHALLRGADVVLPPERVHGFERGIKKEDSLAALLETQSGSGSRVHFVEDRLGTLRRIEERPELDGVRLYYADWGYGTPQHLALAREDPRITVWGLEQFPRLSV